MEIKPKSQNPLLSRTPVFIGEVGINAVECVYVQKAEHDTRWKSAFESFGAKLDPASRALADDLVHVRRGVVEGKLRLEVVT
jgi:hypothetical protein